MSSMEVLVHQESQFPMDGALGDDEQTEPEITSPEGEPSSGREVKQGDVNKQLHVRRNSKTVVDDVPSEQPPRKKPKNNGRRGRKKKRKYIPYHKLTWQEKKELEDRETIRANRLRAKMFAHGHPVAPYNTTQFLMNEHDNVDFTKYRTSSESKEASSQPTPKLSGAGAVGEDSGVSRERRPFRRRPLRYRDSSFSLESDEDFFYSSPEDEEEFLTKDFSYTYETVNNERLSAMNKPDLIREYMYLEDRVSSLESKLKDFKARIPSADSDGEEIPEGEVRMDPDSAKKITIFNQEIGKLIEENNRLKQENGRLRRISASMADSASSSSSGSDSDSSSSSSSSSSCSSSCSTCEEAATATRNKEESRTPVSATPEHSNLSMSTPGNATPLYCPSEGTTASYPVSGETTPVYATPSYATPSYSASGNTTPVYATPTYATPSYLASGDTTPSHPMSDTIPSTRGVEELVGNLKFDDAPSDEMTGLIESTATSTASSVRR